MPNRQQKNVTSRTRWIAGFVTFLFFVIATLLAGLVAVAILIFMASFNKIDDDRATRATTSAIAAMHDKMRGVLQDNSAWDAAYDAMHGDAAAEWATTNWGVTTADYPLYNTSAVIAPNGDEVMAYRDGVAFYAEWLFDPSFKDLLERTRDSKDFANTAFVRTTNGLALVGAARIHPSTYDAPANEPAYLLVFSRDITPALLSETASLFDISGLHLSDTVEPGKLQVGLKDGNGATLAYLTWAPKYPASVSYREIQPLVLSAVVMLVIFLALILLVGNTVIRDLKLSGARSLYKATHDSLSGLLNRAGFLDALERNLPQNGAKGFCLYLLDLDGFKIVNDTWGHATGDELICTVASKLRSVAPRDALVARLGGDEFAVAVPQTTSNDELGANLLAVFDSTFKVNNHLIEVGVSIGVSQTTDPAIDRMELVRQADVALYRAKESGRGRKVHYIPAFDQERSAQVQFEDKLRNAIAMHEIDVHFQPLFHAQSRTIMGVEALARWTLPTGRVGPDIFIPLAERAGLIDSLGALVLGRALDEAKHWPDIDVSVNVSPLQLRNPGFANTVIEILKSREFDARRLTLEITETVLISFPDQAKRAIDALKAVGVKFALDDFGCGYASLGALREFRFDRMKIDRSLVLALDGSDETSRVLNATVLLATALNVPVTAEGIETEEQALAVTSSGCETLQGYLLGRPMSANAVTAIIRNAPDKAVA